MFRFIKLLSLVAAPVLFGACGSDDNPDQPVPDNSITCSPDKVDVPAEGGEYSFNVSISNGEWTAYADDACSSWVSVSAEGTASKQGSVKVRVAVNEVEQARIGQVVVKSGAKRSNITINQAAALPAPTITCSSTTVTSPAAGGEFTIDVNVSHGSWSASAASDCNSWVSVSKSGDNGPLKIKVNSNSVASYRCGTVVVKAGTATLDIAVDQTAEFLDIAGIDAPEGYGLVWHDEFDNGTALGSDWTHEVQGPGWVNNELQNYVNETAPDGTRVTELVDGSLHINCFKSNGKIYSGRVYARPNVGWLYGYFEARIQLPKGKGTWPAFWMMPANNNFGSNPWPGCGEIDIMEEVGVDANIVSSSIHCDTYNHNKGTQKTSARNIGTAESEYHLYACEWTPESLRFYVDGSLLLEFKNEGRGKASWPFTYPFYPILNLAWGGSWGGYAGVDESALPVTMMVDYVRIYQKRL